MDKLRTYTRVMLRDFSLAFNTIQHHLMLKKLIDEDVNPELIMWIHRILTSRKNMFVLKIFSLKLEQSTPSHPKDAF